MRLLRIDVLIFIFRHGVGQSRELSTAKDSESSLEFVKTEHLNVG